jgi:CheY-like chemotaxis protein
LPDGDYLELKVSDTGRGIPLEAQAKVFDPFFTTKSAGHGLGLAIVHGIVRSLGGTIHLTSEPRKGTTCRILVPCAETTVGATLDATSGIGEEPGPSRVVATVLVVEDEVPLLQAVTKMLRRNGFEVVPAADGTSAVDLLRANGKIDMILLDVTIPGASSAEVVAEAAKVQPAAKVILTSAYSQETLAPPINAFEVCGFIRKPFQLGDLVQALRNALSL